MSFIFKDGDTDSQKIHRAKSHYSETLGKLKDQRGSMETAYAFRHGQQWTNEQKAELESQGRPALTFNLIAPTMRELVGANEDQRREPRAAPVGPDDLPTSEVLNHLWQRIYKQQDVEMVEYSAFEDKITCGVGFVFVDASVSSENPNEIEMTYDAISPYEVAWDPDASAVNMEDAQYFYWSRWMSEAEFKEHYPDKAEEFDDLIAEAENSPYSSDQLRIELDAQYQGKVYAGGLGDPEYFDKKNRRLRVMHCEYRVPKRHYYVYDPRVAENGEERGYVQVSKESYDIAKASGAAEVHSSMGSAWRWFEFTGAQVLFDDEQPLPIYCAQIHAVTCYYDAVNGEFYGVVRDLVDPQMEFNKRISQELNLLSQSAQPGLIYDQGAFPGKSTAQVERTLKRPGFALESQPGKAYTFREAPQIPSGSDRMAERAQQLTQMISGIDLNPLLGGQPDQVAVGTAMLSHRKGLLAITPILKNFRKFQQKLLSTTVEVIMRSFSDDQIESMLGDSQSVQVENGVVIDAESQSQVSIRELRSVRWNIEMESAAANTTQQMMMFSLLQQLQAGGMPVDPDVFFSYFPGSRDERHKLISYFKEAQAAQAQAAQAQQQISQQQVQNVVQVEAMKVQQRDAEAKLDANVASEGQKLDLLEGLVKLFVQQSQAAGKIELEKVKMAIEQAKVQIAGFQAGSDMSIRANEAATYAREAQQRGAAEVA